MELTPLDSSYLVAAGHDGKDLVIRFKGGKTFAYDSAPPELLDLLVQAESPGSVFHREIKGKFPYRPYQPTEETSE